MTASEVLALIERLRSRRAGVDYRGEPDVDCLRAAGFLASLLEQRQSLEAELKAKEIALDEAFRVIERQRQSAPEDQVERVARAIGHDGECVMAIDGPDRFDCDCGLGDRVRAAIAAMGQNARNAALEEAACWHDKEAEIYAQNTADGLIWTEAALAQRISQHQTYAAAIRALKRSSPPAPDGAPTCGSFSNLSNEIEAVTAPAPDKRQAAFDDVVIMLRAYLSEDNHPERKRLRQNALDRALAAEAEKEGR